VSRIEADEVAYKEEFMEEQEELKRELVQSLEMQRKNSLSARFRRRQRTLDQQEEADKKWKKIQVCMI